MLNRHEGLRSLDAGGNTPIGLRIRAALGDAGVQGVWPDLIGEAESLRFPSAEGTYVCLRGARWCAWNGQLDKAEALYRLAMKLGSEAGLDLDVENAPLVADGPLFARRPLRGTLLRNSLRLTAWRYP